MKKGTLFRVVVGNNSSCRNAIILRALQMYQTRLEGSKTYDRNLITQRKRNKGIFIVDLRGLKSLEEEFIKETQTVIELCSLYPTMVSLLADLLILVKNN